VTLIELLALAAGLFGLLWGLAFGARLAGVVGAVLLAVVGAAVGFYGGLLIQLAVVSFIARVSKRRR
jgi:hypothetical protein